MAPKSKYAVGYSRPPRDTQFRKGVSGNPQGRPKGSLNFATALERTARELVTITQNGKRRTITKLEAAAIQISNKSASGDLSATKLMIAMLQSNELQTTDGSKRPLMNEDDRKVASRMLERYERQKAK